MLARMRYLHYDILLTTTFLKFIWCRNLESLEHFRLTPFQILNEASFKRYYDSQLDPQSVVQNTWTFLKDQRNILLSSCQPYEISSWALKSSMRTIP